MLLTSRCGTHVTPSLPFTRLQLFYFEQLHVQRSPVFLVSPDVPIDHFVTDRVHVKARVPADDLFRTPIDAQQCVDGIPVRRRELCIAARLRPARAWRPPGRRPISCVCCS